MSDKNKKVDFLVDLPMVFSVTKLEDLLPNLNTYYNVNLVNPNVGTFGASSNEDGTPIVHFLYKVEIRKDIKELNLVTQKVGHFKNLTELMNAANTITVFQSIKEAEIFIKAVMKEHDYSSYHAYVALDSLIDGISE